MQFQQEKKKITVNYNQLLELPDWSKFTENMSIIESLILSLFGT